MTGTKWIQLFFNDFFYRRNGRAKIILDSNETYNCGYLGHAYLTCAMNNNVMGHILSNQIEHRAGQNMVPFFEFVSWPSRILHT
jgi:hypothetical protein